MLVCTSGSALLLVFGVWGPRSNMADAELIADRTERVHVVCAVFGHDTLDAHSDACGVGDGLA